MGLSNRLLGIFNIITTVLSLPIIGFGIYLAVKHHTECSKLAQWPIIGLGAFVLVVSVIGLVGSFRRVRWLLAVYLFVVLLLVLGLVAFTIFAFVVTSKGAGHAVSGRGFQEYRLGDYSTWLQRHVVDKTDKWNKIKSCLVDIKACRSLYEHDYTLKTFNKLDLSPVESGCCKPPTACNFTYTASTKQWTKATTKSADTDCGKWSNDITKLCFECDSCRAGVLQSAKHVWKKVAMIVSLALIVLLLLIFSLGCCACSNSRMEEDEEDNREPTGFYVKA